MNGESVCPVDGCETGLQRTVTGSVVDGVLAHLEVVHGLDYAAAWMTYSDDLHAIGAAVQ